MKILPRSVELVLVIGLSTVVAAQFYNEEGQNNNVKIRSGFGGHGEAAKPSETGDDTDSYPDMGGDTFMVNERNDKPHHSNMMHGGGHPGMGVGDQPGNMAGGAYPANVGGGGHHSAMSGGESYGGGGGGHHSAMSGGESYGGGGGETHSQGGGAYGGGQGGSHGGGAYRGSSQVAAYGMGHEGGANGGNHGAEAYGASHYGGATEGYHGGGAYGAEGGAYGGEAGAAYGGGGPYGDGGAPYGNPGGPAGFPPPPFGYGPLWGNPWFGLGNGLEGVVIVVVGSVLFVIVFVVIIDFIKWCGNLAFDVKDVWLEHKPPQKPLHKPPLVLKEESSRQLSMHWDTISHVLIAVLDAIDKYDTGGYKKINQNRDKTNNSPTAAGKRKQANPH